MDPAPQHAPGLLRKSAYAKHRGVSPALVTRWIHQGRLVLDGKLVDVAASDAALASSLSPTNGGRRKAAAKAPESPASAPPAPSGGFIGAKTRGAEIANELLELKLRKERGELVVRREYDAGFLSGLAPAFAKLETVSVRVAPACIAAGNDVRKVQELIDAAIAAARLEAYELIAAMIAAPESTKQ